jgi:hypothetical protein
LSLTDVLADGQEGDLLVVGAVLRGEVHDLGRELGLHGVDGVELVPVVQSDDDQTRVTSLLAQANLTDLG